MIAPLAVAALAVAGLGVIHRRRGGEIADDDDIAATPRVSDVSEAI